MSRYYVINGRRLPSVTTIIDVLNKPQLVNCAVRLSKSGIEHNRIKNAAADHGTDIHRRITSYVGDAGQEYRNTDDEDLVVTAFRAWQGSAQFVPIASEKLVFSLEHGYAGPADLIGTVREGKLALLDIKTGRGVYPEYKLQLAAYAVAYGEMTGRFPEVCMNLHITGDEIPTVSETNAFTAAELFPLFQTFLAAKRLFEWRSGQSTSASQNVPAGFSDVPINSNRSEQNDAMLVL
jgi:hypothetical protein